MSTFDEMYLLHQQAHHRVERLRQMTLRAIVDAWVAVHRDLDQEERLHDGG